jgi:3-hydroxybutyryl-CoA dehydrogenase
MASDRPVIGAVGAGRMGRGIALAFAYSGHPVTLIDLRTRDDAARAALAEACRSEIESDLRFLVQVGALAEHEVGDVVGLVRVVDGAEALAALGASDVLFECVPETVDAKRDCFAIVDRHAKPDCLITSTTSTIDADTLAGFVSHPVRFCNGHWLNPAHLMPLVEVSPCAQTAPATLDRMKALLEGIGKVPIVCKSSPGFIVPRIQSLAMNEAARLVEEGVASVEDIDKAVTIGFGLRFAVLGLLEFIDWGGCDILYHADRFLSEKIDPQRYAVPDIVATHMATGRKGLRDGAGFYDFAGVDRDAYRAKRLTAFVDLLKYRNLMPRRGGGG